MSGESPRATSGARYAGVPESAPASVIVVSPVAREMPKSVSFTAPPRPISTLPGFTSRCTMPAACAAASAIATLPPILAASAGDSGPVSSSTAARLSEGRYSITIQGSSSSTTTS